MKFITDFFSGIFALIKRQWVQGEMVSFFNTVISEIVTAASNSNRSTVFYFGIYSICCFGWTRRRNFYFRVLTQPYATEVALLCSYTTTLCVCLNEPLFKCLYLQSQLSWEGYQWYSTFLNFVVSESKRVENIWLTSVASNLNNVQ